MKFLIIGLGSMGKRRIRNLQALRAGDIIGFDVKKECRQEAERKYRIKTVADIKEVDMRSVDAVIISTPPDRHNQWIDYSIKNKKPAFVEASVILAGLGELKKKAERSGVLIAPSATFHFHPAVKIIRQIVASGRYGRIVNWSYHLGQYLPDWHPWEKVGDSYMWKKETSGAREMVAFELTWLLEISGFPQDAIGFYGKTVDFGVAIDDTYAIALKFRGAFGTLMVDTTARYAIRRLILNLERAQISWQWDVDKINVYDAGKKAWKEVQLSKGLAMKGYNSNITEDMYVDEMAAFIGAVRGTNKFPNSLGQDVEILKLLRRIEKKLQ